MAYLFDTSAISELFKPRPHPDFVQWLNNLPRAEQYTSDIVIAELFAGAQAAPNTATWLSRIEQQVIPRMTLLPFDTECAKMYGIVRAQLKKADTPIGDADTLISATALHHRLPVVTANIRHFKRVSGLTVIALDDT